MTKDTFILLARYNAAANEKMGKILETLGDAEWNRELGGYFKSVRSLASHIYIADFNWIKRFTGLRPFKTTADPLFARDHSFKEELFLRASDYFSHRRELDEKITAFAEELSGEDLGKTLSWTSSDGKKFEKNFGGALLHMFNHGTHHRGMISLDLELLDRENDFNSLIAVL